MIRRRDKIYEYNNAGQMVAIHQVHGVNHRAGTFTIGAGITRFKMDPDATGKLTMDNKRRGLKSGTFYIETEKTKHDYIVLALRAKLIKHVKACTDIKELQYLYVTTKTSKTQAAEWAAQQNKENELRTAGKTTTTNNEL